MNGVQNEERAARPREALPNRQNSETSSKRIVVAGREIVKPPSRQVRATFRGKPFIVESSLVTESQARRIIRAIARRFDNPWAWLVLDEAWLMRERPLEAFPDADKDAPMPRPGDPVPVDQYENYSCVCIFRRWVTISGKVLCEGGVLVSSLLSAIAFALLAVEEASLPAWEDVPWDQKAAWQIQREIRGASGTDRFFEMRADLLAFARQAVRS